MKIVVLIVFLFFSLNVASQLDADSLMGIPTATDLNELITITSPRKGSIAYVDSEKSLYIYNDANWVRILDNSPVITNEILLEDDDYIYISVFIDATSWMVTRYHKNDINTETSAMGTGAQPISLLAITALTYN